VQRVLTSRAHVSSDSKATIGRPPCAISVLFCGLKRAITLIEFDMVRLSRNNHGLVVVVERCVVEVCDVPR
jgi:hypothetical protein